MSLIDKAYFMLEEIEERWRLPHRDVVYLAENGLLKLSVRLFHVRLEWGTFEEMADGDWARVPTDQRWFSGLQDLREHDAFRLFRDGEVAVISSQRPTRLTATCWSRLKASPCATLTSSCAGRNGTRSSSATAWSTAACPRGRPSSSSATTPRYASPGWCSTLARSRRGS